MTIERQPSTRAECVQMLLSVLEYLDNSVRGGQGKYDESLPVAALHVQQAIDLIKRPGMLDA